MIDRDTVISLAESSGIYPSHEGPVADTAHMRKKRKLLEKFASLIAAHQREVDARVADRYHTPMGDSVADLIAAEIRGMK